MVLTKEAGHPGSPTLTRREAPRGWYLMAYQRRLALEQRELELRRGRRFTITSSGIL